MGLKFLSLLFLSVAIACAVPAFEDELDDPHTPEEIDDNVDDDNDAEDPSDHLSEDENEEEEDPAKKKKSKSAALYNTRSYCVCKRATKKGDPEEDEGREADISDHIEKITKDVQFSDPKSGSAKKFNAFLIKLVSPYFFAVSLNCHCTKKRAVVRLLHYLKMVAFIHRRQAIAFAKRLRYLISGVKKLKKV